MASRQQITKEIDQLSSLKALVQAYAEVAAVRVARVRHAVLENRAFMEGLRGIYETLKKTYRREILLLMQKKKLFDFRRLSLIRRNGRTAFVFLSANTGLYGDLVKKTYDFFRKSAASADGEIVIAGKWGASFFKEDYPGRAFSYFDLPDHRVDGAALSQLSHHLLRFEKVLVFHGRFENIVTQKPCLSGVSGEELQPAATPSDLVAAKYLFEPSLEEILNFFEGEIFASLLVQSLHESLLAKFAARMLNLDAAAERIKRELRRADLSYWRLKHRYLNSKQLGLLAGLSLWPSQTYGGTS